MESHGHTCTAAKVPTTPSAMRNHQAPLVDFDCEFRLPGEVGLLPNCFCLMDMGLSSIVRNPIMNHLEMIVTTLL